MLEDSPSVGATTVTRKALNGATGLMVVVASGLADIIPTSLFLITETVANLTIERVVTCHSVAGHSVGVHSADVHLAGVMKQKERVHSDVATEPTSSDQEEVAWVVEDHSDVQAVAVRRETRVGVHSVDEVAHLEEGVARRSR